MDIIWEKQRKAVKHWNDLFNTVYKALGDKTLRPEEHIHVKVKISPSTYKEYRIITVKAVNGYFIKKYIQFTLNHFFSNETIKVNVYPEFELKSESKIVREDIIFEMLKQRLIEDGFIKNENRLDKIIV